MRTVGFGVAGFVLGATVVWIIAAVAFGGHSYEEVMGWLLGASALGTVGDVLLARGRKTTS